MHNPCLNMSFSYYVTSAIEHDTQQVELSFQDILFGLFSDSDDSKMLQLAQQGLRDHTMRQEFQDILSTTCKYEELPKKLEATESGYDNTYNLAFTRKAFETIDIIVEEDSLVKIMFHMKNPRNSLNAFLYSSSDMKNLISYTQPSHNEKELTLALKAQKKAYKLKIVEDSLDETDQCPTYQMRVALKPLHLLMHENLKCTGASMPPLEVVVDTDNYAKEGEFSISSELIQKYQRTTEGDLSLDITIRVPDAKKDYYFDIETKNDFLTAEIDFSMFAVGSSSSKDMVKIGESQWYDEGLQDVSMISEEGNQRNIIKRLKINNIKDKIDADMQLSQNYILRLKFSPKMQALLNTLEKNQLLTSNTMACFTFDVSLRVTQVIFNETSYYADTDPTENELIRIDWSNKMAEQLFDPRQKLSVFLQFKESVKEEYKTLKFTPFAFLLPIDDSTKQVNSANSSTLDGVSFEKRIYPETVRLSTIDKSSIVLTFTHNSLQKGTCYKLILDTKVLGVRYNEEAFKVQNKLCTTKCSCNTKGMEGCNEKTGLCICHEPFTGDDCNQCVKGFVFDQTTNDCHPARKCTENGGTEDCNGHGTCYEEDETGQAKCICERGFEDDGLDLCGKCADPLFTYPHCESRNWIIEESQYNCEKLPTVLPTFLYNNSNPNMTMAYQNQEGLAFWTGVYKLTSPKSLKIDTRKKSKTQHHFIVPSNSILRLFLDTHDSGVKVNYRVLDEKKRVVAQSNPMKFESTYEGNSNTDMLFLPVTQVSAFPMKFPYTLEIEYEFDKLEMSDNSCHMLEVIFIVQPQDRMSQYLICSQDEISESRDSKQYQFTFNQQPYFFNEHFTLTSDIKAGNNLGHITEVNDKFIVMNFDIGVYQSGNALSIITSYSLEKVVLELTLKDKKTGNVIATEKYASLEDFDVQGEVDREMTDDMLSYIEVSSLEQGDYQLEILLSKALFLTQERKSYSGSQPTCLGFDLTLEYVPRKIFSQWEQQTIGDINSITDNSAVNKFEVLSILPYQIKDLKRGRKTKISLKLSEKLGSEATEITKGMESNIYLQGIDKSDIKINPVSVMATDDDTLSLFFNMNNMQLKNINTETCFKLVLSEEQFKPISIDTRYCIKPAAQQENQITCNPNAIAKIVNNQCVCNHPYKGPTCEQCATGYNPSIDLQNKHTVCLLDLTRCSEDICNNHGRCTQVGHSNQGTLQDFKCECDQKFSGLYCERCKDPQFAYPDCETVRAEVYEVDFESDLLQRRKYNKDGYEKAQSGNRDIARLIKGGLRQQCQIQTYPNDLDRVEFMGALQGGEMHIADYYTINHDTDNLIKFTPKSQGLIKILIQQPELEESKVNDEAFDIEIGIYDPQSNKFLSSSINKHLDFKDNKDLLNGKLDYSWLQFQIPFDKVNKTLYIIFRAVNFTIQSDELLSQCESVYMEIQYTELQKSRPCQNNPDLRQSTDIIKVDGNSPYKSSKQMQSYSSYNSNSQSSAAPFYTIRDNYKQFFYYQDIYLGDQYGSNNGKESDYEVKISVHQKFIEENMIDFMIEVLEEGVAYSDIDFRKYQGSYTNDKPQCSKLCLLSGQKAFNEFHNVLEITAQSLIRVWLHQTTLDGQCANYQLFIEANRITLNQNQIKSLDELKCEELELPVTLNVNRYLGDPNSSQFLDSDDTTGSKQKNFHYLERFRVDNLKDNSAHAIEFTLYEPSLLRVVTTVHKHIEFDLVLKEVVGNGARKLIDSKAKAFEDSIFAQLDQGKYQLQLVFLSEEFYMQQPCQNIQMEIGIVKVADARNQIGRPSNKLTAQSRFVMQDLLTSPSKQQLIQSQQKLQSFALQDRNLADNYQSYLELANQRFTIPKLRNLGVIITIKSDFMLNNVNFALSNINNQRLFHNTRRENQVHLVARDIPGGEYELLIYAHNCLSNVQREGDMLRSIDLWYQIDINFIRWVQTDDFIQHYLLVDVMDKTIKTEVDTLFQKEFKCFQDYISLDTEIIPSMINKGKVDINYEAMIPNVQKQQHVMEYTPYYGHNGLRIIVDYADVKFSLKRNQDDQQSLTESFALNTGDQQLLMFQDLQANQKYYIVFEFEQEQADDQEAVENEDNICEHFRIQIESFKMKDQCQRGSPSRNDAIVVQDTYDNTIMHSTNRVKSEQVIEIKSSNTSNLWITVDFSTLFFIPMIRLTRQAPQGQNQERGQNNMYAVKPQEVYSEIQEMMIYKYTNLRPGTYIVHIIQQTKPRDCLNVLPLRIQVQPTDAGTMLQKANYGFIKTFTSQDEIQFQSRYVQPLPFSLDTYKYLIDEDYILVSEYVSIESEKAEENKITFKINNRDERHSSYFRIYIENNEILMTLKSKSDNKDIEKLKTQEIYKKLQNGEYELIFEYSTQQALQKATLYKSSIHITVMIISQPYYERNYIGYQGSALKNCKQNVNFPLALTKQASMQFYQNEIAFDYQLLRLSDKILGENYALDNYKFRVNETSRFFMTLGMHSVSHLLNLRVTELNGYGNQYMGKQEFNLNVLDVILSAGDYQIVIEQPDTAILGEDKEVCGIFSFHGRITPIQNYLQNNGGMATNTKCDIKEVLPSEIYQSQAKTKNGLEPYINQDGTFNQAYEEILIRKNRQSMRKPEFDRIQITAPEDSLLSILLQYKSKSNEIIVKLFDTYSFSNQNQEPIVQTQSEAQRGTIEQSQVFKLEKGRQYFLFIYYKGELQTDPYTSDEVCEYYNAFISVDTMTRLKNEFTCISNSEGKILSFMKDLPNRITENDLKDGEYTFREFTQLRYPQDFQNTMSYENDKSIMNQVEIKMNEKFTVDAQIKFDFPYSLFDIALFDNRVSDDNNPNSGPEDYQAVAEQLPISYNQQDQTNPSLSRTLKRVQPLRPNNVYYLAFNDEVSQSIMEVLYKHVTTAQQGKAPQQLCLYTEIDFTIKKTQPPPSQYSSAQIGSVVPQIVKIQPNALSDNSKAYLIQRTQNTLKFNVVFNKAPFQKDTQISNPLQKMATKMQMSELINLQVLNPKSRDLQYVKKPVRITLDNTTINGAVGVNLFFDISEEMQPSQPQVLFKPTIDLENLVDQQNQRFILKPTIHMPTFIIQDKIDNNQRQQQQQNQQSQLDQTKKQIVDQQKRLKDLDLNKTTDNNKVIIKEKPEEVKCLCVHGKCRDGDKYCAQCDQGWTGRLCDIPQINEKMINNKDGETKGSIVPRRNKQFKKDGSQMSRDRSGREDTEDDSYYNHHSSQSIDSDTQTNYNQHDDNIGKLISKHRDNTNYQQQSSADSSLLRNQEMIERQREFELGLVQRAEVSSQQQQPGFFSKLFKALEDIVLTAVVILLVVGIAYALLKKSKIKEYMPLPINERDDDDQPQRQMELTEFRGNKNSSSKSSRKSSQQKSSQKQSSHQSSRKSSSQHQESQQQQPSQVPSQSKQQPDKLRTVEFPKDIREQLKQQQEQRQQSRMHDAAFDEATKQLSQELELYANDEDQDSAQRLQEEPRQAQQQQQQNYNDYDFQHNMLQQQNYQQYQNQNDQSQYEQDQDWQQQQQNHYSSSSDQQPQYYDSHSLASSSQQFIQSQDNQYNPFSYIDYNDNKQVQPQQISEIEATGQEIDNVLQEMQDLDGSDIDDDDELENKRLF